MNRIENIIKSSTNWSDSAVNIFIDWIGCNFDSEIDLIETAMGFESFDSIYECGLAYDIHGGIGFDEYESLVMDYLNDNTVVLEHDGGHLVQQF